MTPETLQYINFAFGDEIRGVLQAIEFCLNFTPFFIGGIILTIASMKRKTTNKER